MFSSSSLGKGNLRVDSISSIGGSALTGVGEIRDSWVKDEEGELINEPVRIRILRMLYKMKRTVYVHFDI